MSYSLIKIFLYFSLYGFVLASIQNLQLNEEKWLKNIIPIVFPIPYPP
jgi:hypothetical protein